METIASLQNEALRQLKAIRYLRHRKPLTEIVEDYWPQSLGEFHPIYKDKNFPEEGSWLYLNISKLGVEFHVMVTDLTDEAIPEPGEPFMLIVETDVNARPFTLIRIKTNKLPSLGA